MPSAKRRHGAIILIARKRVCTNVSEYYYIYPYQARQLIKLLEKYGSDAQGSGLNLTGLADLSGLVTVTTTLCITTKNIMKSNLQRYPFSVFWSDEDATYIAIAPDLKGCSAGGATVGAALQELQIAMSLWLEAALQIGKPFPEPSLSKADLVTTVKIASLPKFEFSEHVVQI